MKLASSACRSLNLMRKSGLDLYSVFFDMMTGLLFVFVIALTAYMINFNDRHSEELREESEHRELTFLRSTIVRAVSRELSYHGIKHKYFTDKGLIRLTDHRLYFESGSWAFSKSQLEQVNNVKEAFNNVLDCYTAGNSDKTAFFSSCPSNSKGSLYSLVVEGHTDMVPISGGVLNVNDNMELSFRRAKAFYDNFRKGGLGELKNEDGFSILAVSSYGGKRPVITGTSKAANVQNRRIDFRFEMKENWLTR